MMDQQNIGRAKVSLTTAIDRWIEDEADFIKFPWMGHNVAAIMAGAAIAVLIGVSDTQDYLSKEGLLKDG